MRFVVCGEALIDLLPSDGATPQESPWRALSGGGPMNTAVALGRLGEDVQFLGRFGNDAFGAQLLSHVEGNGVGLDLAVRSEDPTSLAVVSLDEEGKASYTFHFTGTANFNWQAAEFPELSSTDWFHFGSLAAAVAPGSAAVLDYLDGLEAGVSYDINVRPTVITDRAEYRRIVLAVLAAVGRCEGVVKASDEDIELLLEDPSEDVIEVAKRWVREFSLSLFVVTCGAEGAKAILPTGEVIAVAGRSIDLVDTVGAGDTFMAGFLSGYVADPRNVRGALEQGIAAAAVVCSRAGANPPTMAEVQELLSN